MRPPNTSDMLVVYMVKVRFSLENPANDGHHPIIFRYLILVRKLFPDRPMFLNDDSPLAVVFITARFGGSSTNTDKIRTSLALRLNVPAPILLTGLDDFKTLFDQLSTKPCGHILTETARIDEKRLDLGEIKSISFEENVKGHALGAWQRRRLQRIGLGRRRLGFCARRLGLLGIKPLIDGGGFRRLDLFKVLGGLQQLLFIKNELAESIRC